MQNRQTALGRHLRDRIEQRVVGASAREQFDADSPARDATLDFGERVPRVVGIHGHVHPHTRRLARGNLQHRVVAQHDVIRRRKVGR
jgi:hypothetical protein